MEQRKREREAELEWGRRNNAVEANSFWANKEKEEALQREKKRKYAEDLARQVDSEQEAKRRQGTMTFVEKRINVDNLQAFKSWDPNNYASIPGWGGNAKYYNQLLAMKKDEESVNDLNNRLFGTSQAKKMTFAAMTANNVLNN
jgi:predicted CopG family antitoxin